MARTINRRPFTVSTPSSSDIKEHVFSQHQWSGLSDNKNFLTADQQSFEECENVYIDDDGLLKSRPSVKADNFQVRGENLIRTYTKGNIVVYETTSFVEPSLITYYNIYEGNVFIGSVETERKYKLTFYDNFIIFFGDNNIKMFNVDTHETREDKDVVYVPIESADKKEEPNELTRSYRKQLRYESNNITADYYDNKYYVLVDGKYLYDNNGNKTIISVNTKYDLLTLVNIELGAGQVIDVVTSSDSKDIVLFNDGKYVVDNNVVYFKNITDYPTGITLDGNYFYKIQYGKSPLTIDFISLDSNEYFTITYAGIASCDVADRYRIYSPNHIAVSPNSQYGRISYFNQGNLQTITLEDYQYKYQTIIDYTFVGTTLYVLYEEKYADWTDDDYGNTISQTVIKLGKITDNYAVENVSDLGYSIKKCFAGTLNKNVYSYNVTGKFIRYDGSNLRVIVPNMIPTRAMNASDIEPPWSTDKINALLVAYNVQYNEYIINTTLKTFTYKTLYNFYTYNIYYKGSPVNQQGIHIIPSYNITLGEAYDIVIPYLVNAYNGMLNALGSTTAKMEQYLFADSTLIKKELVGRFIAGEIIYIDRITNRNLFNGVNWYQNKSSVEIEDNQVVNISYVITNNITLTDNVYLEEVSDININHIYPDIITTSGNRIIMSNNNTLYVSEFRKDFNDNTVLYFPTYLTQNFTDKVNNIHVISDSQFATFFDDKIVYATQGSITQGETNIVTYAYTNSKISVGVQYGSDILTSFDGTYTIFATERGLAYMAYEQFVASTDQTLTFISDIINVHFKKFNDGPIKLYKHNYWIICYKEGYNDCYILDIRNNSWWYWKFNHYIQQFVTIDGKPKILLSDKQTQWGHNYKLCSFNNSVNNYFDNVNRKENINWKISSHKLHLNAVNNYKHVYSMILATSLESDKPTSVELQCNIYRDKMYENKKESVEYDVDIIRTYVQRLNYPKVTEFQYSLYNNDEYAIQTPLSLSGILIKYKIGGNIR